MREFYQGLENALHEKVGGFLLGLGPLVKHNEFYLAVNSREIRDKLILCGSIVVKERNFKIRSTDRTRFTARVHWAPPFMPSSAIAEALGTECNVETIVYEMCKEEGFETVATGVRLVTLVGDRKKLPHLATITNPLNGHSYELLVTVPGRPPLSLKCKRTGHFRRACQTPFCRHHNQYGHTTELFLQKSDVRQRGKEQFDVFRDGAGWDGGRSGGANSGAATGRGVNTSSRAANACSANGAAGHAAKNQRSGTGRFVVMIAERRAPPHQPIIRQFMKCHLLKRKSG